MQPACATLDIRDEADAIDAICAAKAKGDCCAIVGGGSKSRLGRYAPQAQALSTVALTGVTLYEPDELVLSARAGARLTEIEALLESQGQQFAFEPMDYGPLLGEEAGGATLGGVIAVNASGPRRIKAGAARDHLLGFRCVTGRGELVKSGGRVMKNVTGYDLSKLVCGSYGTLALLTELTLKVLPKPETECTLLAVGADEAESLALLRRATATPCEPSSLAMLPSGAGPLALNANVAAIRLEGPAISVMARRDDLVARLAKDGVEFETLDSLDSTALWKALRDAAPVAAHAGQVWRISVAPSEGFAVVERIRRAGAPMFAHFYDWAGGLIWLCLETATEAHAAVVREAVDASGGHATLIRASEDARACVDVFHPQPAALAALTRRVKESFDPAHILERGRMRAEV
ncbi:glycolate oxidase subunit GlcE [Methylocystis sp. SC2]|uniref:glycolate oxidase subunit GlcE n=1 Tax=Methylocystis sp. (strain SC2) TaxID=187303 RepID=UPI00027AEC4D|nr:glycolate oxidase subunit GlcE [Methylocystis sp. SC2]CCJ06288.1 FAD linked oxidase domain protein [Methylocystis sp. SC2]